MAVVGFRRVARRTAPRLAVLILACLPAPALARPSPRGNSDPDEQPSFLTVRLYNYAKAPEETVAEGMKEAHRLYHRLSIELDWIDCLARPSKPAPPLCATPTGPKLIDLVILAHARAVRGVSALSVGVTVWQRGPDSRGIAYIFHDRVKELATRDGHQPGIVFGLAAAHEIGHVLLGTPQHSRHGLMREQWSVEDLQRARRTFLTFSPAEIARLREALDAGTTGGENASLGRALPSSSPSNPEIFLSGLLFP